MQVQAARDRIRVIPLR
ncbi:BnaAnng30160D [Brassica napus]|uniref:BnaAnng30160D protein n=2 Tax=Brassica TaxID=3705 RepID=A0A078JP74_BRANA|nr:BnaC03g27050D [Brassica napus]CDY69358.1 BnaAnng30160D [Brassica napus]